MACEIYISTSFVSIFIRPVLLCIRRCIMQKWPPYLRATKTVKAYLVRITVFRLHGMMGVHIVLPLFIIASYVASICDGSKPNIVFILADDL
ncbi:hypothetical protein HW555_009618, partial [Spodoptera exigua]